jgi:hypothetical protein
LALFIDSGGSEGCGVESLGNAPNDKNKRVECCYPTQAKKRLEWGTQRLRGDEEEQPAVFSPARKGWGLNPKDDWSAVGAALNRGWLSRHFGHVTGATDTTGASHRLSYIDGV